MTADDATAGRCDICGDAATPEFVEDCFHCGRTFHLNPYNNRPGKDCGDALIGPSLGVHYLCNECLTAEDAGASREAAPGEAPQAVPPPARTRGGAARRRYRRREPS